MNIVGSGALGVLLGVMATHRVAPSPEGIAAGAGEAWRLLLAVGLLGSFTTFSTFSHENWTLWREGRALAALGHAGLSVLLCLLAAAAGALLAERLLGSGRAGV